MAFDVGAIVSRLELSKKGWDSSIKSVKNDQRSLTGFAIRNEKQFKKMGKSMAIAGGVIAGAFGLMVKSAVGFNKEMANVATLIPGQSDRINELKKDVQDLAMVYGKSTTDISGGLYRVISALGDTADTSKILEINVKAAAAGMATTQNAISLTSAVTKAYGDTSAEAFQKVADLAFQTIKLGDTTFPELAASIGKVTPLSEALNISQEELFTTFATLTGVTGAATEVSTQFRSILAAMVKPTEGMGIAMSKLGKEIGLGADATAKAIIKELGFKGTLEGLEKQTDGTMIGLGKLFESQEALVGLLPLLSSQTEAYDKKLEAMNDSVGLSDEAFKEVSEGINAAGFNMERLKSMTSVLTQKLGDKLVPVIGKMVASIGKVVEKITAWMDKHPKLTEAIVKGAAAVGALLLVLGPLLFMLPNIAKGIKLVKMAMTKGRLATMGWMAVVALSVASVLKLISVMKKLKKAREEANKRIKINVEAMKTSGEKLKDIATAAGLTAKEYENLLDKYDGQTAALGMAIMQGKESVELQDAMTAAAKNLIVEVEEETEAIEDLSGSLDKKLAPAMEAVADLAKTLSDEIKKATLDEFEYRVHKAKETFKEREKILKDEGGLEKDFVLLKESLKVELDKIESDKTEKMRTETEKRKKFWKDLIKTEKKFIDDRIKAEKDFQGVIDGYTLGEFELKKKKLEDLFEEELRILFARLGNTAEYLKKKKQLEDAFAGEFEKIQIEMTISARDQLEERLRHWMSMVDQMGSAFGSFTRGLLDKNTTLKDNLKTLWDDIKNSFKDMIASMVKEFITNFVKNVILNSVSAGKAMDKVSGKFQAMGKTVSGIGEGIGKLISSLAKGIGDAIEILATSIANAARSLAAAAPQLLIVGAVALALFAGFKAIQSLFGGGGGKAQDKATEMLQDIRNKTFDIFNGAQWMWKVIIGEQQARLDDHSKKFNWMVDQNKEIISIESQILKRLEEIAVFTALTAAALKNIPQAASGGYFPKETLVHVAENNIPEVIADVPTIKNLIGSGGGRSKQVNLTIKNEFHLQTLDPMTMRDVVRNEIEPLIIESIQTNFRKTKWKEALEA